MLVSIVLLNAISTKQHRETLYDQVRCAISVLAVYHLLFTTYDLPFRFTTYDGS
jgi:hypothetical protein